MELTFPPVDLKPVVNGRIIFVLSVSRKAHPHMRLTYRRIAGAPVKANDWRGRGRDGSLTGRRL